MPVNYIEMVRGKFPDHPPYRWSNFADAPWTELTKPLNSCKVALISSGGLYLEGQDPFNPIKDDITYRIIKRSDDLSKFKVSHDFYDKTGVEKDFNCSFPLKRLEEIEKKGLIGQVAENHYTFMGRCFKRKELINDLTAGILNGLKEKEVDILYLVPS